ncbi:MAG: hypothetical protein KGD60_10785 [Candidatus Thorarchaeota archaeon]|nr:hypothetical protein [Candidatus Thorarchaeota archaeon]
MSSLNRWQVKFSLFLMWVVTIMTPLVIVPASLSYGSGYGWSFEPAYFFLFGSYNPPGGAEPSGWMTGPAYLAVVVFLLVFFIIYLFQVTLYCMKPTVQRWAIVSGVLSLLIPSAFTGITIPFDAYLGGVYVGSLPFQFILGLVVMRLAKSGKEEPESGLIKKKSAWWEKDSE